MTTVEARRSACFEPRQAGALTGQRPFPSSGSFDMSFDIYSRFMAQFVEDPVYAPGPNIMRYPLDDCHADGDCDLGFFGDGDWSGGRSTYIGDNYSLPSHPLESVQDGTFFDFPETGLSRYNLYLREIDRARNGGVLTQAGIPPYTAPQHLPDNDGGRGGALEPPDAYTTWDDFWDDAPDGLNPILPEALGQSPDGIATVNTTNPSAFRESRRVVLAGGIHCPVGGENEVRGNAENVEILDYYRLFLLSPADASLLGGSIYDLNVEVVQRFNVEEVPRYRQVVQLYR